MKKNILRTTDGKWRLASILVNTFLSFTIFLLSPVELYAGNADEFWFGLRAFVPMNFLVFGICCIVLSAVSILLRGRVLKVYCAIIFSMTLGFYLQSYFLNANYGLLDGSKIVWKQYRNYAIINTIIWIFLLTLPSVLALIDKKDTVRKVILGLSALLIIMEAASLVSLLLTTPEHAEQEETILTKKGINEVGSKDNIVFFILDSLDEQYIANLIKSDSEWLKPLDGFVYYSNCVGSYSKTELAVPYLISGRRYLNEQPVEDYYLQAFTDSPFLQTLINYGYDMGIYTENFTGLPDICDNNGELESEDYSFDLCVSIYKQMERMVLFRAVPHMLKPALPIYIEQFNTLMTETNETYIIDDVKYYQTLKKTGLTVGNADKAFRLIHLNATHEPHILSADVTVVEEGSGETIDQLGATMNILDTFLTELKRLGKYDDATIVVVADHGHYQTNQPALLIKYPNVEGPLTISNAPVCHEDLHNTILGAIGLSNVQYGTDIRNIHEDQQRDRVFYSYKIYSEAQVGYMPALWEIHYNSDNKTPTYWGNVYWNNNVYSYQDLAEEVPFNIPVSVEDLPSYFSGGYISWGTDEYTWSTGKSGDMYFRVSKVPENGVYLNLSVIDWINMPLNVSISSGDEILYKASYSEHSVGSTNIKIHIPANCFDDTNMAVLRIDCPNVESAYELGIANDVRRNILGIKSFTLTPGE